MTLFSFDAMQVYCIWGFSFLAALLTLALRNLPSRNFKRPEGTPGTSTSLLSEPAEELTAPRAVVNPCPFKEKHDVVPQSQVTGQHCLQC